MAQHESGICFKCISNIGADLPGHLRNETNAAQEILSGALGGQKDAPNDAFLRRMCEVALEELLEKEELLWKPLKQSWKMEF